MSGIGENISALRKKKGLTQEELGRALGVSMQAVSRWENGGVPDTMLLPALADALGVSIDELFGRKGGSVKLEEAILQRLNGQTKREQFNDIFRLCWQFQRGLVGRLDYTDADSPDRLMEEDGTHSRMDFDDGLTEMGIGKRHNWFFVSPEPEGGRLDVLYDRENQTKLFRLLSEPDAYDALFLVLQRDHNPFTAKLLEKQLNISQERAVVILRSFADFRIIDQSELELDDERITIYSTSSFVPYLVPFLIFADEIVHKPCGFAMQSTFRNLPYLRKGEQAASLRKREGDVPAAIPELHD